MKGSRIALAAALAAAILLAAGCDMPGSAKVFRNNQVPLVVEKGQEFAIALESNPTTGYSWQLSGEFDHEKLELVKKEYEAPATDRLGAPGEEKWTFKAVDLGRATLRFRYVRPWEEQNGGEHADEGSAASSKPTSGGEAEHGDTAATTAGGASAAAAPGVAAATADAPAHNAAPAGDGGPAGEGGV